MPVSIERPAYRLAWFWGVLLVSLQIPLAAGPSDQGADAPRIVVNGREVTSDVPPLLSGGTVLVPLRVVADALGAGVSWQRSTQVVTIRGPNRLVSARVGDPEVR